jgi:hypothetical protein
MKMNNGYIETTSPIDSANLNDSIFKTLFILNNATASDAGINYNPLYYGLFNGISLTIENTHTYEQTIAALKQLQCMAEDAYINQV